MALVMRRLRPEAATALVIAAGALTSMMVLPQLQQKKLFHTFVFVKGPVYPLNFLLKLRGAYL